MRYYFMLRSDGVRQRRIVPRLAIDTAFAIVTSLLSKLAFFFPTSAKKRPSHVMHEAKSVAHYVPDCSVHREA